MAVSSAPLPDATPVLGEHFNALRQDVLNNHDHGSEGGSAVSHSDLADKGTNTHAQLDSKVSALENHNTSHRIIADWYDQETRTSGVGWSAVLNEWNGDEGDRLTVTFSPALPSSPIVVVTMRPGDFDEHGNEEHDRMTPHGMFVWNESVNGFETIYMRDYDRTPGLPVTSPFRLSFIAVCGWS